ncbi:MAG: M15 family metallopeptidase [Pseudonocardiales bacterium]|nr:M15 family metallopeptidase [Pseudonocardiales bacterium]
MTRHRPGRLILRGYLIGLLAGALLAGILAVSSGSAVRQTPAVASSAPASSPAGQLAVTSAAPRLGSVSAWVRGAKPLRRRPDGYGEVLSTPPALGNRRLPTVDRLPPPTSTSFVSTISPVSPQVLARSSWQPICPVNPSQLRYLTLSFRGFDARAHTGEMLVNADVAQAVVSVFKRLFAAGFPIEEMRITSKAELGLPPTGDGNNTEGFVCHQIPGQTEWSAHAYGLAIDLNPFDNPYVKGNLVVPELASSYLNRDWVRSGMVLDGGPAVTAFESVGWTWGGRWVGPVDFMHFSANGH